MRVIKTEKDREDTSIYITSPTLLCIMYIKEADIAAIYVSFLAYFFTEEYQQSYCKAVNSKDLLTLPK